MVEVKSSEITQILHDWNNGDEKARERLLKFVYDELKRQARFLMSRERSDHTLQPTALVHEAFLKLGDGAKIVWKDRSHFYGFAAHLMREILVDHARQHAAAKRGGNATRISADDIEIPSYKRADSIVAVDEALARLTSIDDRQAKIVEMRFFGGMTNGEIAETLDISERTVSREWQIAKLWLYRELSNA